MKGSLFRTCSNCREYQRNKRASNNKPVIIGVYDNTEQVMENETVYDSDDDRISDLLAKIEYNNAFDDIDIDDHDNILMKVKELKHRNLLCNPEIIYHTLSKYYNFAPAFCRCGRTCGQKLVQRDNSYCILEECSKITGFFDMKFIFSDKSFLYTYNIPSINIFDDFTTSIRLKNRRRCQICLEQKTKNFVQCSRCSNKLCHSCFNNLHDKSICSFCRYTMNDHLNLKIDELNIRLLYISKKEKI
jgi:hypothetical protein